MRRSIELALKAILPGPVGRTLRCADNYRKRLQIWLNIFRELDGVTAKDRRILRRAALSAPLRAIRNLSRWQNPVLLEDAMVEVRGLGRFCVRGQSDDLFHVLPSREPAVFAAIRRHLQPGDTFIDAGANMGIYSVLAGRIVGGGGHVLAVEMMPDTAAALRKHFQINELGQARVAQYALAEKSGEIISASFVPGHFGMATVVPRPHDAMEQIKVESRTLDSLTADLGEIALIKMDLEGAELAALKGASQTLARSRVVIFEQHPGIAGPTELLENLGFRISDLDCKDRIAVRET